MSPRFFKLAATTVQMGSPAQAGKGIADIIKFILQRIKPETRPKVYTNLKQKLLSMSPQEIANKNTPPSASIGQAITFTKTILIGHNPLFIAETLKQIVHHL